MVTCASCGTPVETTPGAPAVGAACPACGRTLHATPDRLHGGSDAPPDTAERPAVVDALDHTVVRSTRTAEDDARPAAPTGPRPLGPPPDWRPTTPPPADRAPGRVRYPLYADEPRTVATPPVAAPVGIAAAAPAAVPAAASATTVAVPPPPPSPSVQQGPPPPGRRRRRLVGAIAAAVVLALLAAGGVLLFTDRGDDPPDLLAGTDPSTGGQSQGDEKDPSGGASGQDGKQDQKGDGGTKGDTKSDKDGGKDGGRDGGAPPADLTPTVTVEVPATAEPNQDVDGQKVRYDATNMLDGDPTTCWREPGDGTDEVLTITFPAPVRLTRLGLVNGYAKESGPYNWYNGNRRIQKAEWVLDDGTTVEQPLDRDTELQTVPVDDVKTRTVRLRLLKVSKPGQGRASRDYTAISELSLTGTTTD